MENSKKITPEQLELIERYLENSMTVQKRNQFENELENDLELKQNFEDVKSILLGVEESVLKNKLDEYHSGISSSNQKDVEHIPNSSKKISSFKLAVAASFIIAAGSIWFFGQPTDSEKLYAKYFTPDPGLPTNMSSTLNFEFYDAMVNYKQGDYNIAIKKWEALQKEKPESDTLNYFLGVANLANQNEASAINYLEIAKSINNSAFKNDIYYYLGLAHLKAGNKENAVLNFKQSSINKSKEILVRLNN